MLRVERRHAHEPVHAALGGQQAVGEAALHDERRRQQPGLLSLRRLVDLDGEAAALGPALVHAQQHLGPVLRVGAAGAGVHLAHRVELVVLAREERLQLERAEARRQRVDRLDELGVEVASRAPAAADSSVSSRRARASSSVARSPSSWSRSSLTRPSSLVTDAGVVRVVPQVRAGHLGLELGPADLELVAAEVALGLGQAVPERRELGGEVAGFLSAGRARRQAAPWQNLNFLPLPHQQGSLRPIFSVLLLRPPAAAASASGRSAA